ncbi:MAG: rRNA maturation RNase YbeY [Deltaproteobacteria bacterium]|jgi:probable rRNA maturation factor|nr:rRNA maturation RNase YbeY [Deltaproteobacteria bacterium]
MQVSITRDLSTAWLLPLSSRELAAALRAMWLAFGQAATAGFSPDALLELALVDEAEMARLNEESLGCAGPTNILAFPPSPLGNSSLPLAGLLAMSPRTMRREAWLYGQEAAPYALRLMAHGLAHLLGYEHGEEMDLAAARAAQASLAAVSAQAAPGEPCHA